MRKLKFRVWDSFEHKMHKLQGLTFNPQSFIPSDLKLPGLSWRPVEEFELLQWVYLSDKNGVNVYEGDYIEILPNIYKVVWDGTVVNFQLQELEGSLNRSIIDVQLGSIVGNKFENEDLHNK